MESTATSTFAPVSSLPESACTSSSLVRSNFGFQHPGELVRRIKPRKVRVIAKAFFSYCNYLREMVFKCIL